MARWGDVKLRMATLQKRGFAIFETHAHKTTAFHLADYVSGGDAVLLFTKDVDPAGKLPVLISLEALEELVAAAFAAEREKAR